MRQLAGLLAAGWAAANLYAAYLMATSGLRLASKGAAQQTLLLAGGLLIGLFALLLLAQALRLMASGKSAVASG